MAMPECVLIADGREKVAMFIGVPLLNADGAWPCRLVGGKQMAADHPGGSACNLLDRKVGKMLPKKEVKFPPVRRFAVEVWKRWCSRRIVWLRWR